MLSNDFALKDLIKFLEVKYKTFFTIRSFNFNRHRLISPPVGSDLPSFYIVFKKGGFFQSFNHYFKQFTDEYPEFKGLGESINLEFLKVAIAAKASYLIFIHSNGKKYITSTLAVYKFVNKFNLFRTQDRENHYKREGMITTTRELTATFPILLLESLEEAI